MLTYATPKGNPHLIPTGAAPTFAADGSDISDYFSAGRSFRKVATQAALIAATGMADRDVAVVDAVVGGFWTYNGSTAKWTLSGTPVFADVAARSAAITTPAEGMRSFLSGVKREYVYRNAVWDCLTPVACTLRKTGNTNLTTTAAAIPWDAEVSDPFGMHDNAVNNTRIVVPEPGLYEIAAMGFDSTTTGFGTIATRINGTTDVLGSLSRRDVMSGSITVPILTVATASLVANDYVEVMALHSVAGGAIQGGALSGGSYITVKRIGAA